MHIQQQKIRSRIGIASAWLWMILDSDYHIINVICSVFIVYHIEANLFVKIHLKVFIAGIWIGIL